MRIGKVRGGDVLALVGAALVIVSLLLRWYEGPSGTLDAWDTFGVGIVLLLLAALAAAWLFASALTERSTALPVAAGVWCVLLGLAAVVSAVVRLLERPEHATAVCAGAWVALAGALAILIGAWQSMHDERGSLYPPATPEPRPRP
jgi:hypothetical protein